MSTSSRDLLAAARAARPSTAARARIDAGLALQIVVPSVLGAAPAPPAVPRRLFRHQRPARTGAGGGGGPRGQDRPRRCPVRRRRHHGRGTVDGARLPARWLTAPGRSHARSPRAGSAGLASSVAASLAGKPPDPAPSRQRRRSARTTPVSPRGLASAASDALLAVAVATHDPGGHDGGDPQTPGPAGSIQRGILPRELSAALRDVARAAGPSSRARGGGPGPARRARPAPPRRRPPGRAPRRACSRALRRRPHRRGAREPCRALRRRAPGIGPDRSRARLLRVLSARRGADENARLLSSPSPPPSGARAR